MNAITNKLDALVARFGWRFSHLDAKRAGVPEHVLFDAECVGLVKCELATFDVRRYLVLA